ncbi:MAG: murein biosynthesis integral membrane protein MurJ [Actinobacteria bacterium]|nr:murein biosynthesis integral membrane protein MurJ [Actinomycetota bacterium]
MSDRPPPDHEVLRPRTVEPGRQADATPLRPRTVAAMGRPQPVPAPDGTPPTRTPAEPAPVADAHQVEHLLFDDAPRVTLDADTTTMVAAAHDARVASEDAARGEGARDLQLLDTDQVFILADAPEPAQEESTRGPDPSDELITPRGMLRNNLFVASGTAVSRLTGLARSVLVITLLIEGLPDAYLNANNTPNMIYELILGGILTATLVPLFTDDLEKGGRDGATSAIISTAVVALVAVTAIAFVAAPLIILLLSTGSADTDRADYLFVGVRLALLFAPQVFFYGLMAVWSAALNARHRFLAAAWAPVLNNLVAIATLVVVWQYVGHYPTLHEAVVDQNIILLLGIGTTTGIVVMALALYPSIRRAGVTFGLRPQFRHPAVQRAIRLSGWTFGYVIANLVAANVIQILAKPGSNDPSIYTTAYQFFQLPHGLLAVSIMVTFEPLLGRADARGDRTAFNRHLLLGYRLIGLMIIPAAIGYLALPLGLESRTFVATGSVSTAFAVASVVAGFALGLPGFSSYLYTLRAFYAMKNTKIPFAINCFENLVNIATAIVFVRLWGVVGLAISFAVAYTVASFVAQAVLHRHSPGFDWKGLANTWLRLIAAAALMGTIVYLLVRAMAPSSPAMVVPTVLAGVVVGAVVYFTSIIALRVQGIDELFTRLPGLRRFSRT